MKIEWHQEPMLLFLSRLRRKVLAIKLMEVPKGDLLVKEVSADLTCEEGAGVFS